MEISRIQAFESGTIAVYLSDPNHVVFLEPLRYNEVDSWLASERPAGGNRSGTGKLIFDLEPWDAFSTYREYLDQCRAPVVV